MASISDIYLRLTQSLNQLLDRRDTILLTCLFSIVSCLLQAFSQNWQMMVGFRILLRVDIELKSATIPVYISECASAKFRGALFMFWQFFTAFGIMLGYICDAIFKDVRDGTNNNKCSQSRSPPSKFFSPRDSTVQRRLLSMSCVSNNLAKRRFDLEFYGVRCAKPSS